MAQPRRQQCAAVAARKQTAGGGFGRPREMQLPQPAELDEPEEEADEVCTCTLDAMHVGPLVAVPIYSFPVLPA
jgi:hypothetical protein